MPLSAHAGPKETRYMTAEEVGLCTPQTPRAELWTYETLSTTAQCLHFSRMWLTNCLKSRYPINAGPTKAVSVKKLSLSEVPTLARNRTRHRVCEERVLSTTPQDEIEMLLCPGTVCEKLS